MLNTLLINYEEAVAVILFGIGFTMLLFQRNLIKKLIGMNIMDTGGFLFLASMGYIEGRKARSWLTASPVYTPISIRSRPAWC